MADPYHGVTDMSPAEQQQLVIQTLRQAQQRQQQLNPAALTGMLASDKGMNRMGRQAMSQQTDISGDVALGGQIGRWAQGRQGNDEQVLRAATRDDSAMERLRIQQAGADRRSASTNARILEAANMRGGPLKRGRIRPLTITEQRDLRTMRQSSEQIKGLLGRWEPEFATDLPSFVGQLENTLEREGGAIGRWINKNTIGDKFSAEQAQWWSEYKRFFELPERNETFGATLTDNEQRSWKAAEISEGMEPDKIKRNLQILSDLYDKKLLEASNTMAVNRNNPEAVAAATGRSPESFGMAVEGEPNYEEMSIEELQQALVNAGG